MFAKVGRDSRENMHNADLTAYTATGTSLSEASGRDGPSPIDPPPPPCPCSFSPCHTVYGRTRIDSRGNCNFVPRLVLNRPVRLQTSFPPERVTLESRGRINECQRPPSVYLVNSPFEMFGVH